MKIWSKIIIAIILIFLILQIPLFTPKKNYTKADTDIAITDGYEVPMSIQMDLYNACYDCHSNYTENYPWYYHIQPVSWWMAHHIKEAKEHVNFSEFAAYSPKEAAHKFKELSEVMEDHSMPIKSYLWMHDEAKLTDKQYEKVEKWAAMMHKKMEKKVDSLQEH